eukprot:TRINITY_DN7826_c0_g1_i5.p1 TRINITY_DN7826_c0_g1~~TRINITY_DN7826_c0_g1_i5.p1  ORF type:complete len:1577 (-),score=728.10 TRINITY_DN7826_c0_g1_i5:169-4899(-)
MPSESMDQEMVDALASAQQGKDILAEMVVDLETQLDATKADKAASYVDNSTLANELRRIEGKLAETAAERDQLLESNALEKGKFATSIDELNAQIDSLQFDKEAAVKGLRRNEDASRLERISLEEQLRKSHKFNDDLNEQLASKEIQLARTSSQASEAKTVSRSERQMRELFEGHLSEAKGHQDHLRTRMRELEAEATEATQQFHKATDTIYSLQDQLTECKQQKADALKTARSENALLAAEVASQRSEMSTLERDNSALNKAVEELRSSLRESQAACNGLKESSAVSNAELSKARAKLKDAALDEELLCGQMEQLKDTIKMFSSEKEGLLQQKSGDKETYMEELRTLRGALNIAQSNTEAALTQVRTEKNSMIGELAEISEQLAAAKAQVASLTSQLDTTEGVVAQVLADKEELEAEKRFLDGEVTELQNSLQSTRVDAETKAIENQELQVLMRSQEFEIHDDRADLHRSKGEQALMVRDHDEIRATFEKLRDENELLHAQVAQLQDHIANSEVRMRQLEAQAAQIPELHQQAATAGAAAAAAHAQAESVQANAEATVAAGLTQAHLQAQNAAAATHAASMEQAHAAASMGAVGYPPVAAHGYPPVAAHAALGAMTAAVGPQLVNLNPEMKLVVGENERFRDRVMALEEELAQSKAAGEVDRSILEEQLHHAEARAQKAELLDEIEDKLRAALEEIARLESEMLHTRAEAAERDIQWQAEVDALAETYAQLQAELKQRERDIEEMKEGAWLSAELQYMAKKVEEMEGEARDHVGDQRAQLEKLEDCEVELMKTRAERDEVVATLRALDEELRDEKLANKDLLLELSSLRDELSRAVAEKEKALEAAENYLKRTLEGQNADRDTLKGALKELGSSLETIRSDKERALGERDEQLAGMKAELASAKGELDGALNAVAELEKQLELSQSMLKASLVSASVRFGSTIENFRAGLIRFGMQSWKAYMVSAKAHSRVEELEYRCVLLQDAGKMMALKRIVGRWKNQQLHQGWAVWTVFMEEMKAGSRLESLLANMTAEQRKRALERLNGIIASWAGDHFKARWFAWKVVVSDEQQRRAKMKYAALRMKNSKLGAGFHTWRDLVLLSSEERLQVEVGALKWKVRHTYACWMREKLQYEVTGWVKYQQQRLFGNWKNVTHAVSRVVQKVHLVLGAITRVRKTNAFKDFAQACTLSRVHRMIHNSTAMEAAAKEKALLRLNRVINHHWLASTGHAFRDWLDFTHDSLDANSQQSRDKAMRRADEQGYNRARGQFEGEIEDLRSALKAERGLSFYAHIENMLQSRALQNKTFGFSTWRQWVHGHSSIEEAERANAVIARLKDELQAAEGQGGVYATRLQAAEKELRGLKDDKRLVEDEYFNKVRELQRDLEQVRRDKEHQLEKLQLDSQMMQSRLDQAKMERLHVEDEHIEAVARERKGRERLLSDKQDLEAERDQQSVATRQLKSKNNELIASFTGQLDESQSALSRANTQEKLAKKENEVLMMTLEQVHGELAESKANVHTLEDRLTDQGMDIERYVSEQKRVLQRLKAAEDALAVYETTSASGSGGNLGANARAARAAREQQ